MKKDLEWFSGRVAEKLMTEGIRDTNAAIEGVLFDVSQEVHPRTPELPLHVAKYLESMDEQSSLADIINLVQIRNNLAGLEREFDWIEKNIDEVIRARLNGYTVEEKKYRMVIETNGGFLYMGKCNHNGYTYVDVTEEDFCTDSDNFRLTEKEIKDYDERFWAFAELVEGDNQ